MNPVEKYLAGYAQTAAMEIFEALRPVIQLPYKNVLVIPAYDETTDFIKRLQKHPQSASSLIIVVVNRPQYQAKNAQPSIQLQNSAARTGALWQALQVSGSRVTHDPNFCLVRCAAINGTFDLLALDMTSENRALPPKQGVGLARKTGCDIALAAIHAKLVQQPWIYNTDADAYLPDNYFRDRSPDTKISAIHCSFTHFNPAGLSLAQKLYDLSLEYYVAGLTHAGSRYAHYSLGSALVINHRHYASVRGFPKRAAGEDFYLLNKLAKIGRVEFDPSVNIRLEERPSHRVPYGTGPAIGRIAQLDDPTVDYAFYDPRCFEWLRIWQNILPGLHSRRDDIQAMGLKRWLLQQWHADRFGRGLCEALAAVGVLNHTQTVLEQDVSTRQFLYQMNTGFDGLKTLRLIHHLRDHEFGVVNAAKVRQVLSSNRWE